MATLEQIEEGIRRAHAAGDAENVRILGAAYRQMQAGQGGQASPAPSAPQQPYDPLAPHSLPIPGTIPEQQETAPAPFNETAFAQGTSGINEGIATALGAPVELTNLALRAGAAGMNAVAGTNIQIPENAIGGIETFRQMLAPSIRPESEDPSNQVVRRIGQEVGATLVPGSSIVAKSAAPVRSAVGQLATAAGSGAAAGAIGQVTDNPYAELAAQILGGGAVWGATQAARRAITPFPISAERQAVNDVLAREGVELTPGQMTGNKGLQYAEAELGGVKVADLNEKQLEQFTEAALSRAGIGAKRATPEVMAKAYDDLGKQFDELAARNAVRGDQQMVQDLGTTWSEYTALVNEAARAPIVESTIRDIANALRQNGGTLTGEAYQSMRSRLGRAIRSATDPELSGALRGIQGALDDAMERSMVATQSPDLGAWQQVRKDYANFIVLQNAAAGAGENAAMGLISPAQLRAAVARQNKGAYVRGQGDFAELARAGVAGMTPLPNSGTAARLSARSLAAGVPTAAGYIVGEKVLPGFGGLALGAIGSQAPNALGSLILSGPGRAYLTNQALRGGNALEMLAGPTAGAAINALGMQSQPNALGVARMRALN
jgi:hypothetical protein